jgi:predicted nucleic acid-binding protein
VRIVIDCNVLVSGFIWPGLPIPLAAPVCRDASDDAVLACALAASADMIISGDDDLLSLRIFENIPILSPTNALQILKKDG